VTLPIFTWLLLLQQLLCLPKILTLHIGYVKVNASQVFHCADISCVLLPTAPCGSTQTSRKISHLQYDDTNRCNFRNVVFEGRQRRRTTIERLVLCSTQLSTIRSRREFEYLITVVWLQLIRIWYRPSVSLKFSFHSTVNLCFREPCISSYIWSSEFQPPASRFMSLVIKGIMIFFQKLHDAMK
jgi:hypothetical protein